MLSGCGAPAVDSFTVTPEGKERCPALLEALPSSVGDQAAASIEGSSYVAAWGGDDQLVVLRCGVEMPGEFSQTSECNLANGVGWYIPPAEADDQSSDLTMTTVHRAPAVSVDVPASLRPPAAVMVDLAEVIKEHTKAMGSCR